MKRRLKFNGVIIFVTLVLLIMFPKLFMRKAESGPFDVVSGVIGISLILLGQLFRLSARGYKAQHSKEGQTLIQGGPYSMVRNPMYLGILLIGLGMVLMFFKWWVAAAFISIFIFRYLLLMLSEENKLTALFSDEYSQYCRRVPRILPSFSMLLRREVAEYLPVKVRWVKREIGTILAVLLTALFIESYRGIITKGLIRYIKGSTGLFIAIALFILLVVYLNKKTNEAGKNASGRK